MKDGIDIPPLRDDGLQLEERRGLQNIVWTVQRVAWIGFALVCLLAVLGFTGSGGPFQLQEVQFRTATVEVPRVTRWEGADTLTIRFTGDAEASVVISQPFFDRFGIERIQPEPAEAALTPEGQTLRFTREGPPPHEVAIDLRAAHFGWTRFDMTIGDETRAVRTLILP